MNDLDQIMAEAWMTLADSPCVLFEGASHHNDQVVHATIKFTNDDSWECAVVMPMSVSVGLAHNFYGDEEELDDELITECVGEFINIIAGNIQGIIEEHSLLSSPVVEICEDMTALNLQGIVRNYSTPTGHFLILLNNLHAA
jgi:chemotaxis protein CheY-P-specific phosphatase CheC